MTKRIVSAAFALTTFGMAVIYSPAGRVIALAHPKRYILGH